MVKKAKSKASTKAGKQGRVKTLKLNREPIKNLTSGEQKKIKGGGGLSSSVMGDKSRGTV